VGEEGRGRHATRGGKRGFNSGVTGVIARRRKGAVNETN